MALSITGAMKVKLTILSSTDGDEKDEKKRMYILSRHVTSWITVTLSRSGSLRFFSPGKKRAV